MTQETITITIDVPEGYGVKFNKKTNQIEFIKKDSRPKSWEEYCEQVKNTKCYTPVSIIPVYTGFEYNRGKSPQYNEFDTKEEAKAFAALGKLIQLHKAWVKDWKPDWKDDTYKYVIEACSGEIDVDFYSHAQTLLAFPTSEMRNDFLEAFKDLLEEAKSLL